MWVIFALLDPIKSGSNSDSDPQPCSHPKTFWSMKKNADGRVQIYKKDVFRYEKAFSATVCFYLSQLKNNKDFEGIPLNKPKFLPILGGGEITFGPKLCLAAGVFLSALF
jgi:hypothetical protein